jgi:hypothetical protein
MLSGIIEFVPKMPRLEHLPAAYCFPHLLRCASAIFFVAEGERVLLFVVGAADEDASGGAVNGSTTRRKSFKQAMDNVQTTSSSHGRGE